MEHAPAFLFFTEMVKEGIIPQKYWLAEAFIRIVLLY